MNVRTQLTHPRSGSHGRGLIAAGLPAAAAIALLAAAPAFASKPQARTATVAPNATAKIETSYSQGFSHWATTQVSGSEVHSAPSASSQSLATLHIFTEDGLPETYLVYAVEKVKGTKWVQIGVPMRPNGVVGWVNAMDLGPLYVNKQMIVIDQAARTLTFYKNDKPVFTGPVGVGKPSTPTPNGNFWVREKFPVVNDAFYGPFAIGTSDYSTTETDWPGGGVVGIHGTSEPALVPGDPSHGCVRMHNTDITALYKMVNVGALIVIKP